MLLQLLCKKKEIDGRIIDD
jgi:hypothetical protein